MRVLIADDTPTFRVLLGHQLKSWGYEPVCVSSGTEALAALEHESAPEIALLGWNTPGLSGLDVCQLIRSSNRNTYVYLIVLTARNDKDDVHAALHAGADDYVVKPVDSTELQLRLQIGNRILDFHRRSRELFEEAPVAYHELDSTGAIIRVNRAECDMVKSTAQEILGLHEWEFLGSESPEMDRARFYRLLKEEQPLAPFEAPCRRSDGQYLTVRLHPNLIRDPEGKVIGMRAALVDITEQKRADQILAAKVQELARSNAELEQYAYIASHDLQEPLRMISSYTQLLKRRYSGRLDRNADEFIDYAIDGAHRMQELIQDLLALSRLGTRGGQFQPTSADEAVVKALSNLRASIVESAAEITREGLPNLVADSGQLVQLFQNLIGNAVKFRNGDAPRVHIQAKETQAHWQFSVADNGIGMDPQFADRVFQIFQRLHSRDQYPGTGIGLALCKKIVERHGGTIWFDSAPGAGTTFYFTIPKSIPGPS